MKTMYKVKIGGYTAISHTSEATADPEATNKNVMSMLEIRMAEKKINKGARENIFTAALKLGMTEKELDSLIEENKVYAKVGEEAEYISDDEDKLVNEKLKIKGENRLLLVNREFIPNYIGTEYHIRKSGKWRKEKIESVGVELPENAVLQEDLTREQQQEIAEQQEDERISALPPEKREEEKQNALDNLADEADRLDRRHKIRRKEFNPVAYYEDRAKDIEARWKKYK